MKSRFTAKITKKNWQEGRPKLQSLFERLKEGPDEIYENCKRVDKNRAAKRWLGQKQWVRFPHSSIHLLCMQHFHTISHKQFIRI